MAFFVGILVVMGEDQWSLQRQKTVGLTMAAGMAVSHYSTAYLASAIFAFSPLVVAFFFLVARKRWVKARRVFTPAFCISLVLITVLWNGVVNQSLLGVKSVVDRTLSQGLNLLPNQNQSLWDRWISGTVSNSESPETDLTALESLRASNLEYGKQIRITPTQVGLNYKLQSADLPDRQPLFGSDIGSTYGNLIIFGRTFFQLFAAFGLLLFTSRYFLKASRQGRQQLKIGYSQSLDLLGIGVLAVVIGLIARISGTLGSSYNPERAALQIAVVILIPSAIALEYILFRKKFIQVFLAVPVLFFLAVLLLQATSLGGYISGTDTTRISSLQRNYAPFIISPSERVASTWLSNYVPTRAYLQTDSRGFLALLQNGRRSNTTSLDPVNLAGNSYIYAANSNVVGKVARGQILFAFPEDYLNKNYHLIYSANQVRIYH
jgi:uncharacterized membrane protein